MSSLKNTDYFTLLADVWQFLCALMPPVKTQEFWLEAVKQLQDLDAKWLGSPLKEFQVDLCAAVYVEAERVMERNEKAAPGDSAG